MTVKIIIKLPTRSKEKDYNDLLPRDERKRNRVIAKQPLLIIAQIIEKAEIEGVNGLGDSGFNPRSSHTKDLKMVLDASLLNTQHNKVRIKGKVEKSREMSSALPYTLV